MARGPLAGKGSLGSAFPSLPGVWRARPQCCLLAQVRPQRPARPPHQQQQSPVPLGMVLQSVSSRARRAWGLVVSCQARKLRRHEEQKPGLSGVWAPGPSFPLVLMVISAGDSEVPSSVPAVDIYWPAVESAP